MLSDRSFVMYVLLTRFQAAMYFSMQSVTHRDSELESDVPGFAMHFSKHENLIDYIPNLLAKFCTFRCMLFQNERCSREVRLTCRSFCAFATLDSLRTCSIIADFNCTESI